MQSVIASRSDRLGGRFRNMCAAWDFASKVGAPLVINWPGTGYAKYATQDDYSFFDLFDETDFKTRSNDVTLSSLSHEKLLAAHEGTDTLLISGATGKRQDFFDSAPGDVIYNATSRYMFAEDEAGLNKKSIEREIFHSLRLNAAVAACLEEVSQLCPLTGTVSVHVRRGDIVPLLVNAGLTAVGTKVKSVTSYERTITKRTYTFADRYAPVEAYESAIDTLGPNTSVCVFSDDDALKADMKQTYKDRIIDVDAVVSRHDLTSTQIAFVEMLVMSKTDAVVCANSAFSLFASFIGRCEVVEVLPFVNVKDLMRDFERYFFQRDDSAVLLAGLKNAYQKLLADTLPTKASFIRTLTTAEHAKRGWDPELAQQEIEKLRDQLDAEREQVASLRDALAREKERRISSRISRLLRTS